MIRLMRPQIIRSKSDIMTNETGRKLARKLKKGALLCLYGDLGAGKTTFIRGLAAGLGITSKIQSPTFTYQRVHHGKTDLYHFDCYRIADPDTLIANEINEALLQKKCVVAIEWAERIEEILPARRINVRLTHDGELRRIINIQTV